MIEYMDLDTTVPKITSLRKKYRNADSFSPHTNVTSWLNDYWHVFVGPAKTIKTSAGYIPEKSGLYLSSDRWGTIERYIKESPADFYKTFNGKTIGCACQHSHDNDTYESTVGNERCIGVLYRNLFVKTFMQCSDASNQGRK